MRTILWLARDADGRLYLYKRKPIKKQNFWCSHDYVFIRIETTSFLDVKWEDPGPTKVEIKIIK